MIIYLASLIVDVLIHNKIIKLEQVPAYQYGFEIFISSIITCSITVICGLILKCLSAALLYFGVFVILRSICGGYHAKTYWQCNLIFTIVTVIVLLIYKFISIEYFSGLHVCCIVFSLLIVIFYAPIENKNKALSVKQKKLYRFLSTILMLLFYVVSCVLKIKYSSNYSIVIDTTIFVVALSMFVTEPKRGG